METQQAPADAVPTPVQLRQVNGRWSRRTFRLPSAINRRLLPNHQPPTAVHTLPCKPPQNTYMSAEEALEATGFLADRPPQEHGESGHSFYTVQPQQLLSLHPRAYLLPRFVDAERCQKVIDIASRRLAPSGAPLEG